MDIYRQFLLLIVLVLRSLSISVPPDPLSNLPPRRLPSNRSSELDPPFLANVQAGITKALVQDPRCLFEGLSAILIPSDSFADFANFTLFNLDFQDNIDDTELHVSMQSSTSHLGERGRLFVFPYQGRGDTWFELNSIFS